MAGDVAAATAPSRPAAGPTLAGFGGAYAGTWLPDPAGSCAALPPVERTMLVEPFGAVASGVNYPLRGLVAADGWASLGYGKAALVGRFGPDGFAGRANTGGRCAWLVSMARLPPIGHAPSPLPPPADDLVAGEAPAQAVQAVGERVAR